MANTKNIGSCSVIKENFDLMKLVIIRLGDKVYNGEEGNEGYRLLRFLNTIMYPHRDDFMDTVAEYIDFSKNEELWEETKRMTGLGQSILEEGRKEGRIEGRKAGRKEGRKTGIKEGIRVLILDNLEEQISKERIIEKLQKHYKLSKEMAEMHYAKVVGEK